MSAEISLNGEAVRLRDINNEQKLPEMQFYFAMEQVKKTEFNKYLGDEAYLGGDADLQGLMTGFGDLLFEHNGKYNILHWKSNHLGNSPEDYSTEKVGDAMTANNYHLQYIISAVAVKRWLEQRIPGFDYNHHFGGVIYLFLRGVRKDKPTGIFTKVPEKGKIEELEKAFKNLTNSQTS